MTDVIKVTVTNTTDGPKIFNSATPALLNPGHETGPLEITAAELKSMRSTGYFEITGGPAKADDSKPGTKPQLLDIAKDEGIPDVSEAMTVADITSAIELHREG